MLLGERLSQLRKEAQIKAEELAAGVGVKVRMVYLYEKNSAKPSFDVLVKTADYFGVSLDYLIGRSDDPRINEFRKKPSLAERLKTLRKEKNITQEEFADVMKVSSRAVRFYEAGKREPTFSSLTAIADYFGVSTDYLLVRSDDPRSEEFSAESRARQTSLKEKETELIKNLPASLLPAYQAAKEKNPENLEQIIDTFTRMAKDYYSLTK